MELTFERYFESVKKFDEKFSTLDFEFEGTDFWPLVRIQVLYYLYLLNLQGGDKISPSINETIETEWLQSVTVKRKLLNYLKYIHYTIKSKQIIKAHRQLICFFDLENHKTVLPYSEGKTINPFVDGFASFCNDLQFLDLTTGNIPRLNSIEHAVQLFKKIEYSKIKGKILKAVVLKKNIETIEIFINETISPDIKVYHFLLTEILNNQVLYKAYLKILPLINPEIVWTYNYANSQVMAMNRACEKLKINTVEYQHSVQSDQDYAYLPWTGNVKKHAPFFPKTFWAWRVSDKSRVEKNFKPIRDNINVILGGNLYLAQLVEKRKKRNNTIKSVLITLQGFWIPEFIEQYIINDTQYKWYVRLHPRYPQEREKLIELANKYPDKIEYKEANRKSLYELFDEIEYHLTSFSGSALEAQTFNVQNIIYSQIGYNSYKEYIEEGAFFFVDNNDSLNEILVNKKNTQKLYDPIYTDRELIKNNLSTLLHSTIKD